MVKTTQRHKRSKYEMDNDKKKKASIAAKVSTKVTPKTVKPERPIASIDGVLEDAEKAHRGGNVSGRNWKSRANSRSSTRASR